MIFWVAYPAAMGFYPWAIRESGRIFQKLNNDQVFRNANAVSSLIHDPSGGIAVNTNSRKWTWAALTLSVLIEILTLWQGQRGFWDSTPHIGKELWVFYLVGAIPFTLGLYMLWIVIFRFFATIHGLWRVFRIYETREPESLVRLRPWHPDGCGGLGSLKNYALRTSWFMAAHRSGFVPDQLLVSGGTRRY